MSDENQSDASQLQSRQESLNDASDLRPGEGQPGDPPPVGETTNGGGAVGGPGNTSGGNAAGD